MVLSSSSLRFERDERLLKISLMVLDLIKHETYLEAFEVIEGAAVYLVKVVGAIETSVITSTLCRFPSSTP